MLAPVFPTLSGISSSPSPGPHICVSVRSRKTDGFTQARPDEPLLVLKVLLASCPVGDLSLHSQVDINDLLLPTHTSAPVFIGAGTGHVSVSSFGCSVL